MNQTYQNFISVLATQPTSKIGFIKVIMILEFVQNIGLSLPKHGWQQLQYDEKMISSIQQLTNYTLFLKNNSTSYLLEAFIILLSVLYFVFIGICSFFPQQQKISILGNISLTIFIKIGRMPLTIIYFDFLRQNQSNFGWIFVTVITFTISFILKLLTTYFQRDMQINFSREYFPINQQFIPVIYFVYVADIFRIVLFTFLNDYTGFVLFSILSFFVFLMKMYVNAFQQNDPEEFNQSLIICNLSIQIFLLIGLSSKIDEKLIFNILLYFITLIFHIGQNLDLKNIIKTEKNIIHSIQNQIKNNFNSLLMQKINSKYDDSYYINFIKGIIDEEIKFNRYFQNENNVLILFEYLSKKQQSYFQALFILNKFECQRSKLSIYYQLTSHHYKTSIQNDIRQINKSGLLIQQLNKDLLMEVEYQRLFKEILSKQIDFLGYMIGGSKSFYELEFNMIKISRSIENTIKWLKRNNILDNKSNFIYLKISINFNTYIMLYPQALKLKQIMKQMLTNDHKTIEAILLLKSKAVVITVSLIRQKGLILNFFGLSSFDYKLEFLEQLMPEAVQPYHSLFIERYLTRHSLKSTNQQSSLEVLQQQENGIIQCLEVNFTISNDKSDFILISLLKKVNQERGYIIFDSSGRITGISEQIQEIKDFSQLMKNYPFIQYFCSDINFIMNNNEFSMEKEINLIQRVNLPIIDKQFKNFLSQQNRINQSHFPSNFEYLSSDRSEKFQLLNSKNHFTDHEILIFDISDSQFQEKLNQIINLNITEQDILIKCKAKLSKVVYLDEIIQYQLEIIPIEMKVQNGEEEILNDQILQIENMKARSMNDVSVVSSEQKASYLLHDVLLKQQNSRTIQKVYFLKFVLLVMVVIFIILALVQLETDFDIKLKYTQYINAPNMISDFYNSAFSYGFYKIIYQDQDLNQSRYLKNCFDNFTAHQIISLRNNFQILYPYLVKINEEGYTKQVNISFLQQSIISDELTVFSSLLRENYIILLTYPFDSLRFLKSILFFRQNIISAYNLTLSLVESFSNLLTDYSSNFLVFWQTILIVQIIFYLIPFLLNLTNWYNLEKRHKYILQIMSRINEDQAQKLIDIKQQLINFFDSEKQQQISMNQSYYTCKSPGKIMHTTINSSYQNLRYRDTQLLYEKISNKNLSIFSKLLVALIFYILLVIFSSVSFIQIKNDDAAYMPIENLLKSFIKFQSQLTYLISMTSTMNGQKLFYNQIKDVEDAEIGNIDNLFINDQIPTYFSNISQTYSKKIISLFSTIVLSDNIDDESKQELYNLYKDDFCYYLVDFLPFCNSNLTISQFQQIYGEFYQYENNSEVLSKGIIGFISKLDSLIKNNFDVELSTQKYQKNTTTLFYQKDFNNLVVQYMFNVTDGFQLFYEKVNSISINLNTQAQSNLRIYYFSYGFGFLFLYTFVSFVQVLFARKRYKSCVIGLVTLSDDLLNDKTNLSFLKKLSR